MAAFQLVKLGCLTLLWVIQNISVKIPCNNKKKIQRICQQVSNKKFFAFSFQNLFRVGFLIRTYFLIANLAGLESRLVPSFQSRLGHTMYPPTEVLLVPTCIEPTPFRNSASKVVVLRVHATTPSYSLKLIYETLSTWLASSAGWHHFFYDMKFQYQNTFKTIKTKQI